MGSIVNGTHRIVEPIIDVPVVIVGGGGCGLTTSIFLSDLGVDPWLSRFIGDQQQIIPVTRADQVVG